MWPEKRVRELRTELMPDIAREITVDPPGLSGDPSPVLEPRETPASPITERALCGVAWHFRTPALL